MMLNVVSNWIVTSKHPNEVMNIVPLGTEFKLVTSFHDNTGREFTAGAVLIKIRSSRFDLVKVRHGNDNTTFSLSIRRPGHTVIKAWSDSSQKAADYVKVHAEQTIIPIVVSNVFGYFINYFFGGESRSYLRM